VSTPLRIGAFAGALALIFGAAFGIGKLFDDDEDKAEFALRLSTTQAEPGRAVPVSFRIEKDGEPVTGFDVRHEKRLHLIAVTHEFQGFQHVHPTMAADGTWSAELDLTPGQWRLYGDFEPAGGTNRVSHADLSVPGLGGSPVQPIPSAPAVVDGYQLTASGDLVAGGEGSMLEFNVTRNGKPVTDLQPYLGAYGHLVVLRDTDMKYLHVHPEDGPPGPGIPFHVEAPTAGRYHLFLDFKHRGVVRTASFVLDAKKAGGHDMDDMDDMGGMDHGDH